MVSGDFYQPEAQLSLQMMLIACKQSLIVLVYNTNMAGLIPEVLKTIVKRSVILVKSGQLIYIQQLNDMTAALHTYCLYSILIAG